MKRLILLAASAVVLTVGCQKIQELVRPGSEPVDDTAPVEIRFTTNVVNVETKANGAVIQFGDAHQFYVYGLNQTTGVKEIPGAPARSTAEAGKEAQDINWVNGETNFYNGTLDKYDFYAYYADDAEKTAEPTKDNNYTFDVTITGQQDLLLAKALGSAHENPNAYSARTAREGVVPNLEFEHQLSQFTFSVRNHGNTDVTLEAISLEAVCEGTMVVAGPDQGLTAKTAKKFLDLPMTATNLVKKADISTGDEGFIDLDASIMAFPAKNYTAKFYMTQTGMDNGAVRAVTVPVQITNAEDVLTASGHTAETDPGALKGYSYNLQVTVYSLAQIQVTATLAPWNPGKVQVLDTEDEDVGASEAEVVRLLLNGTTYAAAAEGETFTVDAGGVDYEVSIPAEATWITNAVSKYEFTVAPNDAADAQARTAEITFTAGSETRTLTVNQEY